MNGKFTVGTLVGLLAITVTVALFAVRALMALERRVDGVEAANPTRVEVSAEHAEIKDMIRDLGRRIDALHQP